MITVLVRRKPDRSNLLLYYVNPLTQREESRSAKTSNYKDALRAAAQWEQEIQSKYAPSQTDWEGFRIRFRDEHTKSLSAKSQASYATALNHFEKLIGTPSDLAIINASVVSQFQGKLRATGMEETSIGTHLRHFRSALKWAASVGMIAAAPSIKIPKTGKRRLARGRPITEAEFKLLLKAVPEIVGKANAPEWVRLLRGQWLCGLRLEESMRLSWNAPPCRVDLDGGWCPRIIWFAEGHKGDRDEVVPMTPDFAAFLRKTPASKRIGPVFAPELPNWNVNAEVAGKTITAIGEKSGILVNEKGKFVSAQDLRRSFGTRWALKVRPMTLKALMRHADITTTLKYYVDLQCDDVGAELWGNTFPKTVTSNGNHAKKHRKNTG